MSADKFAIPDNEDKMPCHAAGETPEGYDAADSTCHDCADKFSCLPAAVANPACWTKRGVTVWAVADDVEVSAVLAREMSYATAIDRIRQRMALREAGKLIPASLLTRRTQSASPLPPPDPVEDDAEDEDEDEEDDAESEDTGSSDDDNEETEDEDEGGAAAESPAQPAEETDEMAQKKTKAKVKRPAAKPAEPVAPPPAKKGMKKKIKKKAAEKPAKAAAAPAKAKAKAPAKSVPPPKAKRPTTTEGRVGNNGKRMPGPCPITKDQVKLALEKVKLGMKVDLDFGMQIVRRARDGHEHIVTITDHGFMYNDELYSSLSAAAQNASGTPCRSGNDWFNLATTSCTEVRDKHGKVIARKGMNL